MTKPVILWVHPNFKKKMKVEAANQEISVIKFTEMLSNDNDEVPRIVKKKPFTFRL